MSAKQSKPAKKKPAPAPKKAIAPKAKPRAAKTAKPELSEEDAFAQAEAKELTANEELFAQAYLANGLNGTQAYMTVHPKAKRGTAAVEGSRTLAKPHVARRVRDLVHERAQEFEVDGKELLRHTSAVANADHRLLTQYVYRCCRYCHGVDHGYHRTLSEFDRDREKHQRDEWEREAKCLLANKDFTAKDFDEKGGPGFNEYADPHDECPNCHGHGVGRMEIADTRKLPDDAVILFAGVEETKDGLKVRMHDKMAAQNMLFKHKGLFEADNSQLAAATSPEALLAMAQRMEAGRAAQLKTLAERRGSGFSGD